MKLFITAGIGQKNLLDAAERIRAQVAELKIFDSLVIVTEDDLFTIAPWIFDWYTQDQLQNSQGYGYYAWKASIAAAAANGYWGNVEDILYLDAGCEVLPGRRSRRIIRKWIGKAKKNGAVGFSSYTPEWRFTKSELMDQFPEFDSEWTSEQFQSGTWFLSGAKGRTIANEWNQICSTNPGMTNNVLSIETPGFLAHRHDQSVFSMVLKKHKIKPEKKSTPYPNQEIFSYLTGLRSPLWAARNRTGKTAIPLFIRIIARLLP